MDGFEFVIAGANADISLTLRTAGLDVTLPLAPDLATALGSAGGGQTDRLAQLCARTQPRARAPWSAVADVIGVMSRRQSLSCRVVSLTRQLVGGEHRAGRRSAHGARKAASVDGHRRVVRDHVGLSVIRSRGTSPAQRAALVARRIPADVGWGWSEAASALEAKSLAPHRVGGGWPAIGRCGAPAPPLRGFHRQVGIDAVRRFHVNGER